MKKTRLAFNHYTSIGWLLRHPKELFQELKWFIQRGLYGYSDRDVWGICDYLVAWMPSAIDQLRKNSHSFPTELSHFDWHVILAEIKNGWQAGEKWLACEYTSDDEREEIEKTFYKGFALFYAWFWHLWD